MGNHRRQRHLSTSDLTTGPDVVYDDFAEPSAALNAANLKIHVFVAGTAVTEQNPRAGATVKVGAVADLDMGPRE